MEMDRFDALTRALAGGMEPRRVALRLLAGGALAGLAARLGLDDAAAKKKRGKRHGDTKRSDHLHAAGKKSKKHKPKKDKDKPKQPRDRICDNGKPECPDGSCVPFGQCCPGHKRCADGFCHKGCCPGEKPCTGFGCIPQTECCTHEVKLCPDCDEPVCENGNWECRSACLYEVSVCCKGECLLPCDDGKVINPETCQCECPDGQEECPGGGCVATGECCPPTVQCQEGCCPEGFSCHHLGSCCSYGPPLFCTCPSGYRSEGGLCVPA